MHLDAVIYREDQLGVELNKSVHQARRNDFAMLLSLLSEDALEFSQFHLPKGETDNIDKSEDALKKQLEIGPSKPLAPSSFDMTIGAQNTELVHAGLMDSLRLQECLDPEPLHIRNDKSHLPLEVVDNLSPHKQNKIFAKRIGQTNIEASKDIDAAQFYDHIQSGEMQNMLISA